MRMRSPLRSLGALVTVCLLVHPAKASAQIAPVMVGDLVHGVNGSNPGLMVSANGRLVFGPGLGFSDGTPAGTEWPAPCDEGMSSLPVEAGGLAYLVGSYFPYRTDGTCAGTYRLADDGVLWVPVNPGPGPFAAVGTHVFFFGWQGLWRTDGTPEGTTLLRTFSPAEGQPVFAAAGQTRLYFETDAADGTATLWTSDGTAQGTIPVTSFVDGANDVWAHRWRWSFAAVGDRAFFSMYTPAEGVELWTSDGTPGGTALVADLQPGAASSDPVGLIAFQGRLAFVAWGAGALVYTSDGTAANTAPIHPSFTANFGAYGPVLFTVGGRLVAQWAFQFLASDGTQGVPPVTIGPGTDYTVRVVDTVAYYSADDGVHGDELWQTDGTPAGTHLVADLCPGACDGSPVYDNDPRLAAVGGALFFAGNDGVHGRELWRIGLPTPGPLPSARTDAYSVNAGATLTVAASGVLANDQENGTGALTTALVTPPGQGALTFGADGGFTFTAPTTPGTVTFTYRALNSNATSAPARVLITVLPVPPVAVDDHYTTAFNTTLTVAAPGVLVNDNVTGGAYVEQLPVSGRGALAVAPNGGFTYVPPVGFVGTTSFGYRTVSAHGSSDATITITVGGPTTVQPPANLQVTSVAGNTVTVQWTPPALGPTPTGWVFEAGVDPGQPLMTLPTGDARPAFSFTAPAGSYFVRIRAVDGAAQSAPSSEIRVFVAQPLPPAAPTGLVGLANGAALTLGWQPSYARGEVSSFALDVTGAASLTLPLDAAAEGFSFAGVPAGTYTFAVRALNAYGSSPASNAVTLTFPTACSGAPDTPTNVVTSAIGSVVSVRWDAASTGAAPASYVLQVTGTLNGSLPLTTRAFSAAAPPGTYGLSVIAVNACGVSAPSTARTVTVP